MRKPLGALFISRVISWKSCRPARCCVLGEVSKRMMVSAGNITALVERLIEDGYIKRTPSSTDRPIQVVSLTGSGRIAFRKMADRHAD